MSDGAKVSGPGVSASFEQVMRQLLRPPGGGIPAFSAGLGAALPLQRRWYRAPVADAVQIEALWTASRAALPMAQVAILGVPLDTGAGIRRGAAQGPRAVRDALLALPDFVALLAAGTVVDLGDVFVNAHLLHDEMLAPRQIDACREAMYPHAEPALRATLPVSALSQTELVLSSLRARFPKMRLFVIGGDHSCAWPVTSVLAAGHAAGDLAGDLALVQPDAHTDLLPSRLGVKYCFGTWSYHANELLGRGGRLVQLGIRQSGRDRAHWESTTGVRQFWAHELRAMPDAQAVAEVIAHLRGTGITRVYLSNDIDGTDEAEASATGTPAGDGLGSGFLLQLIAALGREFELVAADVMEVAPDLAPDPASRAATTSLAARYALASIEAMLVRAG